MRLTEYSTSASRSQLVPGLPFTLQPRPINSSHVHWHSVLGSAADAIYQIVENLRVAPSLFRNCHQREPTFRNPYPPIAINVSFSTFQIQVWRLCRLWRVKADFPAVMLD
jgi:hypothetical protein